MTWIYLRTFAVIRVYLENNWRQTPINTHSIRYRTPSLLRRSRVPEPIQDQARRGAV